MFNRQKKSFKISLLILMIYIIVLLPGCAGRFSRGTGEDDLGRTPISPEPAATSATVTLYFADEQVMYLVPEQREVIKKGASLEEIVVKELIKGPAQTGFRRTIPPETSLLSLTIINGVVYVNFSGQVKNSGWGGSAGETMLVYSVVNSLAELPGITGVQFLVEGEKLETLFGHIGTMEPVKPDWSKVKGEIIKTGSVPVDFEKARELQNSTDQGHQPWRCDPVRVAMNEGQLLGFDPSQDSFALKSTIPRGPSSGAGEAKVEVVHGNKTYFVQLIQPVKQGQAGIWVINSVTLEQPRDRGGTG